VDPLSSKQGAILEGKETLKQYHVTLGGLNKDKGISVDFIFVINGSKIPP
jgi:hypothetical protein